MAGRRTAALMGAVFLAATTWGTVAHAQDNGQGLTLAQRVSRLERLLDSQNLVDMYTHIQKLQQDVEQLRGQVEEQNNTIADLRKRQRDLYLDLDRRVSALERGGSAAPSSGGGASAPAAGTTAAPPAVVNSAPSPVAGAKPDAQNAYEQAFELLRNLRYAQAIQAFQGFLKQYPKSAYDQMAQYWIGEADYAQQHYKKAIADYQKLIANYPHSSKVPEAMLKIGYSRFELGDNAGASAVLKKLNARFPDTTEASQGQKLLQKIQRAG